MVAAARSFTPDEELVLTRVINAPPALVFELWTTPEHLTHWFGPKDFVLPTCEVDFRVGGKYRFCMRAPDGTDWWVSGTYQEIIEPSRIVFTWERVNAAGEPWETSVVTITIAAQATHTLLTLQHAPFSTVKDRDDHVGGWSECFERLAAFAERAKRS